MSDNKTQSEALSYIIDATRQHEILSTVARVSSDPHTRHILMVGVQVALGNTLPAFWTVNISSGRSDRLFTVEHEKKSYDVLGLKGKGGGQ